MYMDATAPAADILECTHQHCHAVRRIDASGVLKVYVQCIDCGAGRGARRKADYDVEALPWWDEEVIARRREAQDARYAQMRAMWDAQREQENEAWQERYRAYLHTDHWARVKRRALLRDNFRCQHCGKEVNESTSQAHHIRPWGYETFNRFGYSMLFEVVTLCTRCHAAAEGRQP